MKMLLADAAGGNIEAIIQLITKRQLLRTVM